MSNLSASTAPHGAATGNIACFAAMAMWSAAFPAVEILLLSWGVVALIAVRMALGAVMLCAAWIAVERTFDGPWRAGIVIGGLGFGGGASLLLIGQSLSGPVTTAIAASMTPIAGVVIEFLFDRKRPTALILLGVALAIVGGLIATGAHLTESDFGLGALICLASVFVFSWGTRATTRLEGVTSLGRTAVTTVGAAVFCLIVWAAAVLTDAPGVAIGATDGETLAILALYALVAFAVAQILWLWGAASLGILLASLHMNAVPFYVMIAVVIAFEAEWSWAQAGGAAIVALGVILSQTEPRNWRRRRRETSPR